MLGGIVATFMMAVPFVTLALAFTILIGMVVIAVGGRRAEKAAEVVVATPKTESA
jgi:hypothetical protein